MDLATIRTTLDTALQTVSPSVRGYKFIPKKPQVPCYVLQPHTVNFAESFDGLTRVTMAVHLFAGDVNTEGSQTQMDSWLTSTGSGSIVAALLALGIVLDVSLEPGSYHGYLVRDSVTELLSCRLNVSILT